MDGMSVFANNRIWLTSGDGAADVVGVYLVFYIILVTGLNNAIVNIQSDIAVET